MSLLRRPRLPRSPEHLSVANNLGATEIKILKEIAIMKKLRHPNVVQLEEVLNDNLKERIYMGTLSTTFTRAASLTPRLPHPWLFASPNVYGAPSARSTSLDYERVV